MYVVNVDSLTSTCMIHVVGGCGHQSPPGTVSPQGHATWSDYLLTLEDARAFAVATGKQHVKECQVCESRAADR